MLDVVHAKGVDLSEFGEIIQCCHRILSLKQDFSVRFVSRQANQIVHTLARETGSQAHPIVLFLIFLLSICRTLGHPKI